MLELPDGYLARALLDVFGPLVAALHELGEDRVEGLVAAEQLAEQDRVLDRNRRALVDVGSHRMSGIADDDRAALVPGGRQHEAFERLIDHYGIIGDLLAQFGDQTAEPGEPRAHHF